MDRAGNLVSQGIKYLDESEGSKRGGGIALLGNDCVTSNTEREYPRRLLQLDHTSRDKEQKGCCQFVAECYRPPNSQQKLEEQKCG